MQEDLRQHLGLQKSAAVSAAAAAGQLKDTGRVIGAAQVVRKTVHRPPFRDSMTSSSYHSDGHKSAEGGFHRWAAYTGSTGCLLGSTPLHASPRAGVQYGEERGRRPQRPMSAPAKGQARMQASHRPHSASRCPRGGRSQQSNVPQPKWQGKNAYRHENTAIRTKLSRHRPVSAIIVDSWTS
jgi:hypothetical protein